MLIHTAVTPKIPVLADAAAEAPLDVEEAPLDVEDVPLDVEDAPHDVEEAPHDVPLDVEEAPHDVEDALAGADVEDVVCKKVVMNELGNHSIINNSICHSDPNFQKFVSGGQCFLVGLEHADSEKLSYFYFFES